MKAIFNIKNALFLFFGLQVAGLIVGRFTNVKFFAWAPYDELSYYEISVELPRGLNLTEAAIEKRYRKRAAGRENRTIHNLISLIRQYETTYGKTEQANVQLRFNIHGRQPGSWHWPADTLIFE